MTKLSILNFVTNVTETILGNTSNNKFIPWGVNNQFPSDIVQLYDTVPEHSSALDFIESLIIGQGLNVEELDYWTTKKIVFDYILFGGYMIQVLKTRNGGSKYEYVDISKCRFNKDMDQIGVCDKWGDFKANITWYPIVTDKQKDGIFYFKNNKSRFQYPRPYYLSGFNSLDTLSKIIAYHNNNATNGFSPNVIINIPGVPEGPLQDEYERKFKEKFTGNGQKFVLSFSDSTDTQTSIVKLQDDNLDSKFKDLQLFLRDEIVISHKLTSGQLIGVSVQGNGFSKVEYDESLTVFKDTTIEGFRNELSYSFTKLTGIDDIKFLEKEDKTNITVDQTTVATDGGQV